MSLCPHGNYPGFCDQCPTEAQAAMAALEAETLARIEADRRQQGTLMPSKGREPEQAPDCLAPLKVQWRSEHRYLAKEKQRIEQRMKELEEMLESFFGEAA